MGAGVFVGVGGSGVFVCVGGIGVSVEVGGMGLGLGVEVGGINAFVGVFSAPDTSGLGEALHDDNMRNAISRMMVLKYFGIINLA
jgi:hypothetical protein